MNEPVKPDIKALGPDGLNGLFKELGQPGFRAAQVYNWLFHKDAASFTEMTNLPRELRQRLAESFSISRLAPEKIQASKDGTKKILFGLADKARIESVLIPERDHWTLCASSQVGCRMGCAFCLTGTSGLVRNLEPAEIIGQVQAAARLIQEEDSHGPQVTNIVFMGMGEPLDNLDNLTAALKVIVDPQGLALAWRRVTVSTVGLIPGLKKLVQAVKVRLAVSLNAPDDQTRSRIMPVNRRFPLDRLIQTCKELNLRQGERITFEYVMLKGVNDSPAQAGQLVRLLAPLYGRAKVNLIPFNEHPSSEFRRPSAETVQAFRDRLLASHLTAMVRRSMGRDILAACGQLRGEAESRTPDDQDAGPSL